MDMTLREYLETLDENAIVAIGCKNGTSFMYISKAGDEEIISKCFENYLDDKIHSNEEYKSELKTLCFNTPDVGEDEKENVENITRYAIKIKNKLETIENTRKYIRGFKPVLEREVVETYHKDVDNCEAIIIEGYEYGRFWFKSEFDKSL